MLLENQHCLIIITNNEINYLRRRPLRKSSHIFVTDICYIVFNLLFPPLLNPKVQLVVVTWYCYYWRYMRGNNVFHSCNFPTGPRSINNVASNSPQTYNPNEMMEVLFKKD